MNTRATTSRIRAIVEANREVLDADSIDAVSDYLEHGEPEMALEGLCLDLMKCDRKCAHMDRDDVLDLARQLGLDQEPVFDAEFWQKLDAFL